MANIQVKTVEYEPTAPYSPNTIYLIRKRALLPHKAWRLHEINTRHGSYNLGIRDLILTGLSNYTTFQNPIGTGVAIGNPGSDYVGSPTNNSIGVYSPDSNLLTQIRIRVISSNNDSNPSGWIVQSSDDTTDGSDGTWTTEAEFDTSADSFSNSTYTDYALLDPIDPAIWISSSDGTRASKGLTRSELTTIINNGDHAISAVDITTRDALPMRANGFVLVDDASADPGASEGPNMYYWLHNTQEYVRLTVGSSANVGSTDW